MTLTEVGFSSCHSICPILSLPLPFQEDGFCFSLFLYCVVVLSLSKFPSTPSPFLVGFFHFFSLYDKLPIFSVTGDAPPFFCTTSFPPTLLRFFLESDRPFTQRRCSSQRLFPIANIPSHFPTSFFYSKSIPSLGKVLPYGPPF